MAQNQPQTISDDYPERVRQLRVEHGLTQERLAELLGVSFATVNRWENAQSRPSPLAWEKVLRAESLGPQALSGEQLSGERIREPASPYAATGRLPRLDFAAKPESVRVVAEAERLTYGHLFNPAFASEVSRVDPLPHQRIAVYERMLPQSRLRFLLADDAGAGKTIMAGLYVRQMLARRLIRRVLIVPPAGLVGNWKSEMRTLFSLPFEVATGTDAREGNPFEGPDSNLLIVSVDTLAGERMFSRLAAREVEPYDLVVFDEAHKLSAYRDPDLTVRKTDRYCLAEAIAGANTPDGRWQLNWRAQHLLLLTATPHMGKDYPYYCLWRLLEPEVLATVEAFNSYPQDARQRHLIRRTKEEMVRFDGSPIYPMRVSDTLTYRLTQGEIGEQALYEQTTSYLETYYNKASVLNRSAARLAMSIFQRRLASSTYALLRSLERRMDKLEDLIDKLDQGLLTPEQFENAQAQLGRVRDVFETMTADEEEAEEGREANELAEDEVLAGVAARSAEELRAERHHVAALLTLARQVYERGDESKFVRLREVLENPRYRDEKLIIFTEHRDTLDFLVGRLESIGFTGQIARIHGGMNYTEREEQVEFFRKLKGEGGAQYLVATDAAGEGINLQFCWLMVNYDVPWNPARLEQRMGRIHRYGQRHDPVVVLNLVAENTREGRVVKTLLEKMERIRKELGSDKVFDVVGRMFKEVSIKDYMERIAAGEDEERVAEELEAGVTKEQVEQIKREERRVYGQGGEVVPELDRLRDELQDEQYLRLLPGYVRRFMERAAPLLDLDIEGDPEGTFSLRPLTHGALDPLWPVLESYPPRQRERLTVRRPEPNEDCIWLRPGEPLFDHLRELVLGRFRQDALRGAVFIDPTAGRPYMFHLASITVRREADRDTPGLQQAEVLESRLLGLRQEAGGSVEQCPVEHLLMLKGCDGVPIDVREFAGTAAESREEARAFAAESVARDAAEEHRRRLTEALAEREDFVRRGFDYQEAELANARSNLRKKAREGNAKAAAQLDHVKVHQQQLSRQREEALTRIRREPELVAPGPVEFVAHALVVPTSAPEERKRHDAEVERIAMQVAVAYEETFGATVHDVSTPDGARAAGLTDWPGFDLLSERDGDRLAIEVKGRARTGEVELSENEWAKACNLRDDYWLYVVYRCASSQPQLHRVRDPFGALIARARGGVIIEEHEVVQAADTTTEWPQRTQREERIKDTRDCHRGNTHRREADGRCRR